MKSDEASSAARPKPETTLATKPACNKPPRRGLLSRLLSTLGLMTLFFVFGAAVMFFKLPSSDFLSKAFIGARAWVERRQVEEGSEPKLPKIQEPFDQPGKTVDGFTLCVCASLSVSGDQAFLLNMRGEVVHQWTKLFSQIWDNPPHIKSRVDDRLVAWFGCHLFGNGDLLVVLHAVHGAPYGYGLVKLDKDSKVLWKYAGHVHHDVDVGEDGTIYAIQHELLQTLPKGLEALPKPCLADSLVLLTPDGRPKGKPIPILEAFRDSPYAPLLTSLERADKPDPKGGLTSSRFDEAFILQDAMHTNFVRVLTRKQAAKFPQFKAGQVLISVRGMDCIAVVDVDQGKVVWAARGPWKRQHDAQFLDNGHILLFDNRGLGKTSRILEYDPQTQAFPWSYTGADPARFFTVERGMSQRLPNGNTLIVISEKGEMLEVTPAKEAVWSCIIPKGYITNGRRYPPEELHFLKEGTRARPR